MRQSLVPATHFSSGVREGKHCMKISGVFALSHSSVWFCALKHSPVEHLSLGLNVKYGGSFKYRGNIT